MTSRGGDTLKTLKKPEDRLDVFPAFMKVAGRRVLVVGHGGEAAAKVRLLGETNARIVVVSKIVEPDLQEAIDLFETEHLAEDFQPGHLKDAALVFSAREDWDLDKAVVDAARAQGVPVNAVDKPELCDFYTGALVNRAPIAVAITSTGVGPVLSRHIRARIEAMLPRSTGERNQREASKGKQGGRTLEIQRLIGRSLRAALDMTKLGDITLYVDCDVIQADGGTRTASITGAMVALVDALKSIKKRGGLKGGDPLRQMIAAVSVGMYQGEPVLDLDYLEDSAAETDLNVVMTSAGGFIEVQGTAEGAPFQPEDLNAMLALAQKGMSEIFELQKAALAD